MSLVFHALYETIVSDESQTLKLFLINLGLFIRHISFCTNFFIYVIVSKAFRQELRRLTYRICGQELQVVAAEEENARENNVELNVVTASVLPA
jgi:hypothetical protein